MVVDALNWREMKPVGASLWQKCDINSFHTLVYKLGQIYCYHIFPTVKVAGNEHLKE